MPDILGSAAGIATLVGQPEIAAILAGADAVKQLADSVASFVEKSNPGLFTQYSLAVDNLTAAFGKLFEPLVEIMIPYLDQLNELITSLAGPFEELFDAVKSSITPLLDFAFAVEKYFLIPLRVALKVLTFFETAFAPIRELFNSVLEIFATLYDAVSALADVFIDTLLSPLKEALNALQPVMKQIIESVKIFTEVMKFLIESAVVLLGGKISRGGKTVANAGGQSGIGIEDIGKQFRDAALSQSSGKKSLDDIPPDITEIKNTLNAFFEYAKSFKQAADVAGGSIKAGGDALTLGIPGAIFSWAWNNYGR